MGMGSTSNFKTKLFIWGKDPDDLTTPDGDDVLPTFIWNQIWCADDGYDIEISLSDDPEFDNPIYNDISATSSYTYYELAPGLIPGESYKWRVRIHSFGGKTTWINSENVTINAIEIIEPSAGATIGSVRPTFNINAPKNIGHFEIMIGDKNDTNVDIAEVYNREEEITVLPWEYPATGIDNGLFPGMIYYWKLLMFDQSGNLLGDIDDYEVITINGKSGKKLKMYREKKEQIDTDGLEDFTHSWTTFQQNLS